MEKKGSPSDPSFSHFKEKCVCCEQSDKKMNKEHLFPQWLLKRTKASKDLFSSPYGPIPGDKLTVPLCCECNSLLGEVLEKPVSRIFESIESNQGFNDYEAELLIRWMWKINGLFYWSICNENWKYGFQTLKDRVLNNIEWPRERLSIAISLIDNPFENGCNAPVGIDVLPLECNLYAVGVFSKLCIIVFRTEYMELIDQDKFTVYTLNANSPLLMNPQNKTYPVCGFSTGQEAISYAKVCFGPLSQMYMLHEAIAQQVKGAFVERINSLEID